MTRREKEKKASLDALSKFAYGAGAPLPPPKAAAPPPPPRRASPTPARAPEPAPATDADRRRQKQLEERREKLEEERRLRDRRAGELARGSNMQWRGMDHFNIPASIRRTGFDREEPTVSQKINDILGDAREKEGRAKARDKGRRQGGR